MELEKFIQYCNKHIKGDEKGEAQIFLDRFFVALGYEEGLKGAGAECEFRLRDPKKKTTSFGDLVWKKKVLIEMKKSAEDLSNHLQQATSYWLKLAGDRPRYVILCNFNEFWIYDFDVSIYDPAEKLKLEDLEKRKAALSFLYPIPKSPVFGKDFEDITARAVEKLAAMFKSMVNRRVNREDALRYCLQCIVSMFAEDVELLPDKIFSRLIKECIENKVSTYDLIGGLFREMNTAGITPAGKYAGVDYFNGGLFEKILPIELTDYEITMLDFSASHNWRNVNPAIFGTIFEKSLELDERHKLGAHYTHEIDIKKIVDPVIVQPWIEKIENAETLDDLYNLLGELTTYTVLDPACGSGNFLFVAFKELKLIERNIISLIKGRSTKREDAKRLLDFLNNYHFVNSNQFFGIDIKPFAVELAKVTLMVAKEISWYETKVAFDNKFKPLPLDNLDKNILCADSLIDEKNGQRVWPQVDAIVGNPPYQGKRNMQVEFGADYVNKLRAAYSDVPGRADFCVYWFYKAHKALKQGSYAGLVGTNTITQNYSREGSLEYIVKNGGEIFNAYQSFKWSGEAAVTVSIVSWKKGKYKGEKLLYTQETAKSDLEIHYVPEINSSLSLDIDVTSAKTLDCNTNPKVCFQGQVPGEDGFFISPKEANRMIKKNPANKDVLKPHLIADDLLSNINSQPSRFCIDFTGLDMIKASSYKDAFKIVEEKVKPLKKEAAEKQIAENKIILKRDPKAKTNKHHISFYDKWWHLAYGREDLLEKFTSIKRYIACSGVSKRNIFEFVSSDIIPNAAVFAFCFDDDYSFGIIQSIVHFEWWKAKCSTFETRLRYTSNTVWNTFPWPQNPTIKNIEKIAKLSKELRDERNKAMKSYNLSLRDLYRTVEQHGKNPVKDLQNKLDVAVMEAYGIKSEKEILQVLLNLNLEVAKQEQAGKEVIKPGLPHWVKNKKDFITTDSVKYIELE